IVDAATSTLSWPPTYVRSGVGIKTIIRMFLTDWGPLRPLSLLGLRRRPHVRFHRLVAGEDFVGLFVRDRSGNDHVFALAPVRRRCHTVLGRKLERIQYPKDLV